MKHLTFADKSLLVGDEVADLMIRYASMLATAGSADAVDIHAYSSDGDEVIATFLLNEGSPLMAETTHSRLPEPDNTDAIRHMRGQMGLLSHPPTVQPEKDDKDFPDADELDDFRL
ncbi:MAG TPA: hypothetical protein VGP24_11610 [Glaciihabitans sp.]|jgi:hypothetical protein|nr:hypothetical protein [Glaciihabitans sp.]